MCGILGKVDRYRKNAYVDKSSFRASLSMLSNRGPDSENIWSKKGVIFGHTRLSVIDLSDASDQPMQGHGYSIVFNGEIYNYKELRNQLIAKEYRFRTNSDTEIILAGWHCWGASLLDKINGMFAFAIFNLSNNSVVIARDRYGKKPLYYTEHNKELIFSSNLLSVESLCNKRFDINLTSLSYYFKLRYTPGSKTMLDGVSKLEPGSLLTYDQNGINITQWNNNERDLFSLDSSERYSAKDLRDTIITSVHDRMISDVPLGVFLSGGIDSAVIATAMSKKEKNINTFTVGFPDSEKYDESQYALKMARHLNSNHTEINITNNNILDSLDLVFDGLDEPFSDNSSISTYILSQHVKNHITVALSGDGGDEVFGGYRKYKASMYADKYRSMPNLIQDSVNLLIGKFHDKYPESFLSIYRFLKFANESSLEASLSQIMGTGIEDNLILGGPNASVESLIKDQLSTIEIDDPINKLLIFDQKNSLADQMLTKVDRMSMAASLEVRSPFLDHRVVSMANKIKGSRKISIGKNKPLLEQAFKNDIPKYVFRAKKKGFGVPMSDWIRKEILDIAKWSTDSDRLADQGLFNHCIPTQWLDKHLNYKGDYSKQIWSMIVFQKWYERRG